MPVGFLSKSNISITDLAHGIRVAEIPGDGGVASAFILIVSISGLIPGTPCGVSILSPTTIPKNYTGTADGFGNASISTTWTRDTDDTHWLQSGGGAGIFPDGFWNLIITGNFTPTDNPYGGIDIQFGISDVISFTSDLNDPPTNPTHSNDTWDGSIGTTKLKFDITSTESPDSVAVVRDGVVVANVPYSGNGSYEYVDSVFSGGTYTYEFFAYKYPDSRSASSSSFSVSFGGVPTFEMIGSGGLDLGGSALFQFLVDPSGIYTLTPGKTHDTIYADTASGNATTNVKFPNPFVETAFIGD